MDENSSMELELEVEGGNRTVFMVARGKSLQSPLQNNYVTDPKLELFDHAGQSVFSNDNWSQGFTDQ